MQRSSANGKLGRRTSAASPNSSSAKRGSDKRRSSTSVYVLRDSTRNASNKEKASYLLVSKRENHQFSDNTSSAEPDTALDETAWERKSVSIQRKAEGTIAGYHVSGVELVIIISMQTKCGLGSFLIARLSRFMMLNYGYGRVWRGTLFLVHCPLEYLQGGTIATGNFDKEERDFEAVFWLP